MTNDEKRKIIEAIDIQLPPSHHSSVPKLQTIRIFAAIEPLIEKIAEDRAQKAMNARQCEFYD